MCNVGQRKGGKLGVLLSKSDRIQEPKDKQWWRAHPGRWVEAVKKLQEAKKMCSGSGFQRHFTGKTNVDAVDLHWREQV